MDEIIIKKIGLGPYLTYSLVDGVLSFGEDQLSFILSDLEEDFPVHIDVCKDENDVLVQGIAYRYAAQIDIPARSYQLDKTGGADQTGIPFIVKKVVPFDLQNVVLTLWPLK